MLLFAHLAAGYLAGLAWNRVRPQRAINVWTAMLGGILPDLIDKPISIFIPGWDSTRTIGHTLLFLANLLLLGKGFPACKALALGVATHLVLDSPWTYWQTLFWPFLGPEFRPGAGFHLDQMLRMAQEPLYMATEAIGLLFVVAFGIRYVMLRRSEPPLD